LKTAEQSIVVNATAEAAFARWKRLEDFPRFWDTISEVRQIDEKRFLVLGDYDGHPYEMMTEQILQIPARRIAWRATSGTPNSGVICFDPEVGGKTRVTLKVMYEPDEHYQHPTAVDARTLKALVKFKELIENEP